MAHVISGRHGSGRNGFTLVELVAVIVILGILSATASAKFVSLQSDARANILRNMQGSIKSANSMVFAKALINHANTSYTEKGTGEDWSENCAKDNCVSIGDMWVYLKYAYVDRNSVAFILDADISGIKTRELNHGTTGQKIKLPKRDSSLGDLNYNCDKDKNAVCTGHDFCQCRSNSETIDGISGRDTQYIVPKGFKYYQKNASAKESCYFKYSSAEYLEYKEGDVKVKKVFPPAYTLALDGC